MPEARTEFCLSEAFFMTSVYTFFFSAEDAFRMKSEKAEEVSGLPLFNVNNLNMGVPGLSVFRRLIKRDNRQREHGSRSLAMRQLTPERPDVITNIAPPKKLNRLFAHLRSRCFHIVHSEYRNKLSDHLWLRSPIRQCLGSLADIYIAKAALIAKTDNIYFRTIVCCRRQPLMLNWTMTQLNTRLDSSKTGLKVIRNDQ